MQAVTAGTAASGVIVTALRIVAKAAGGETLASKRAATIAFFLVTLLICVATLALYWLHLRRLPVYVEHTKAAAAARGEVRPGTKQTVLCLCRACRMCARASPCVHELPQQMLP